MVSPDIPGPMAASFVGGAGTVTIAFYRKLRRIDDIYRMLAGHDERDGDGLIDQVEQTHRLARQNRNALREEGVLE
ncbi:MAG: hypothetical protein ABEJ55_06670 [Halanaeroarchaeum sp.]